MIVDRPKWLPRDIKTDEWNALGEKGRTQLEGYYQNDRIMDFDPVQELRERQAMQNKESGVVFESSTAQPPRLVEHEKDEKDEGEKLPEWYDW